MTKISIPIKSDLGITVTSLDKTYKRLLPHFANAIGKYTFAGATPEIFKGLNYTNDGTAYAPSRMKTTRALKQRFIDFWKKDWRGKKTAIMMLDVDQEVSPDIWAQAGLPTPFLTNSNPAYGTCQIIWIMSEQVYDVEYYQIRDSMITELEKFGVKVDRSKPDLMRSPFYDPFMKRNGKMVKRKADSFSYIKRGKVQADYTMPTVYEWNEYDPEDLFIKSSDLNDICWDLETGEVIAEKRSEVAISVLDIQSMPHFRTPYNPAGSTSLFDMLREKCYPLYSKKKIWGFDLVLSIARQLGEGQSEKKIIDTAKGVFDWIEVEFAKSHDATKAANGNGTLLANIRWYKERAKKALLTDFANLQGFSRQYAHKLSRKGKIYEQFGGFFYTKDRVADPVSYVNGFRIEVVSKENGSSIHNKHVNQAEATLAEFFEISRVEVERPPPIPPPKDISSFNGRQLAALWDL